MVALVTNRLAEPWEDAQEETVSPGAFMTEYAPLSSREAEKLHEEFARDFLASLNDPTINSAATERLSEKIYGYQDFIFDVDPNGMSEEEKKQNEQLRALRDWAEYYETKELEEERMRELSAADKDFLSKQMITLGGVRATALDWVKTLDEVLDDWDKSFNRMVSEGYAKPEEKDKRKLEVERLRKLMARTDISEAEKQKLIEQGIANGTFSRDTVDFVKKHQQNQSLGLKHEYDKKDYSRMRGKEEESTRKGHEQFSAATAKPSDTSEFFRQNADQATADQTTKEHKDSSPSREQSQPTPAATVKVTQVAGLGF